MKKIIILISILFIFNETFSQVSLFKDINQVSGSESSDAKQLLSIGSTVYFVANDGNTGFELWKTNGTDIGTVLVKDINEGLASSNPSNFTYLSGTTFYFVADDGRSGYELWKSDGTEVGTVIIKDIYEGLESSNPSNLIKYSNKIYFAANDGLWGSELWKTDGSIAGTTLVKDIFFGEGSSSPSFLVDINGVLFFQAYNDIYGVELWSSYGTTANTQIFKDINPGLNSSVPEYLTFDNNAEYLYFAADDGINGKELWIVEDIYSFDAYMLKDINTFSGESSNPSFITEINGFMYFAADDGNIGNEFWISDGTPSGTKFLKDIRSGSASSNPQNIIKILNDLYFSANNGTNGTELWTSDGTPSGTVLVKDINSGTNSSSPVSLTNVNDTLYFSCFTPTYGNEIWKSDGTEIGTDILKNIANSSTSSYTNYLINSSNKLFFTANDGIYGNEIWLSNGTDASTSMIKDINSIGFSSSPQNYAILNNKIFFAANDGINGNELWVSDGTLIGTLLFKDIFTGISSSDPENLFTLGNYIFFTANNGTKGAELWISDGTEIGTTILKDIYDGFIGSNPQYFTEYNNKLYFSASDGSTGIELWESDGTEIGTLLVSDIIDGAVSSDPHDITTYNNEIYFSADDGFGFELWKSDGTDIGTIKLKDINSVFQSNPANFTVFNNELYFTADDGINGIELWKTDGTEIGTNIFQDICIGEFPSNPENLIVYKNSLYFTANDGINGNEIWKTEDVICELFVDVNSGELSSNPSFLTELNEILYFVADDGFTGSELWQTDGTLCYTKLSADIELGSGSINPEKLFAYQNKIFFSGNDNIIGNELWTFEPEYNLTISPLDIPEYCSGTRINVPVSTNNIFDINNIFTVQISDEFGNFSSPTDIGSIESQDDVTIECNIPLMILDGTNYKLRVSASNPSLIGDEYCDYITIYQSPSISDILDQTTIEDVSIDFDFTISDNMTNPEDLIVGFNSDNTSLLPIENILMTGTGNDRNINLIPVNYQNGISNVNIYVSDANGCSNSDDFIFEVTSVNNAPYLNLAVPNQTTTYKRDILFTFDENTFIDPDQGDILDYTSTLTDETPLPSWLNFDSGTRTFSGTNEYVDTIFVRLNASDANLETIFCDFEIQISKAILTVWGDTLSRYYLEENPEFIVNYNGFADGDTISDLNQNSLPTTYTDATPLSDSGHYEIYFIEGYDLNYDFSYFNGLLYVLPINPEITTDSINNVTQTTATVYSNLINTGGDPEVVKGICYGLNPNPTIETDLFTTDGNGFGVFITDLTDLILNSSYYVKSYATNLISTTYGEELMFTTLNVDINESDDISIISYPNPVNDIFTIEFSDNYKFTIRISDITGRMTGEYHNNSSKFTLDLSTYKNGIYFIDISGENITEQIKVIKM